MSRSLTISIGLIVLLFISTVLYKLFAKPTVHQTVHYHAGFIVYKDGERVDFSESKYMSVKPCEIVPDEPSPLEIQMDKGHLHENVGDVVHVHTEGAKWGDLFANLKYPIDYSLVSAYINGDKVLDFENRPIVGFESAVIFIGNVNESLLSNAVATEHIRDVESNSELCGS